VAVFYVYLHRRERRLLVTGRHPPGSLPSEEWELVYSSRKWRQAYEYAVTHYPDYVIEFFKEEMRNDPVLNIC